MLFGFCALRDLVFIAEYTDYFFPVFSMQMSSRLKTQRRSARNTPVNSPSTGESASGSLSGGGGDGKKMPTAVLPTPSSSSTKQNPMQEADYDWQNHSGSLVECNRFLLTNKVMVDINFLVRCSKIFSTVIDIKTTSY